MRIIHIAAGAGGMYCGACARDAALARALIRLGHDVEIIPLYTPLRDDAGVLPTAPVFYGGISVALQQASRLFRRAPAWVGSALDSPALLRAVSRFAIEVRAENLGPMTVSVLAGRDGRQGRELDLQRLRSAMGRVAGWQSQVIAPVRAARRALRQQHDAGAAALGLPFRRRLAAIELDLERVEQCLLAELAAQWPRPTGAAPSAAAANLERYLALLAPARAAQDLAHLDCIARACTGRAAGATMLQLVARGKG